MGIIYQTLTSRIFLGGLIVTPPPPSQKVNYTPAYPLYHVHIMFYDINHGYGIVGILGN